MKRPPLSDMTVQELVENFAGIAMAQDEALLDRDTSKFSRLFHQMQDVSGELKARPGDQRRALLTLYDHPNAQVRLKAADATLAVAPKAAREKLKEIAESHEFPQAGDAGMALWALEKGISTPT
ncbi:MAG: DUF2019 domain-containing protein [Alphaproteobacteria bacterium]|nr:DUF2019 domain-containing protein [Alphaproteobacteria bacterium]